MRPVYVVGAGMTRFGRSELSLVDLAGTAALAALRHASLGKVPVDGVVVANMGGSRINRQTALASALVDRLALYPAAAEAVENGPASGASAVKVGYQAVASSMADVVLVVGAEMMRVVDGLEGTDFVASLSHPEAEYIYGVTLPSLAGLFARLYMS
ncbi:MAG: acetyl-CoA acetyltransferase, partial [bacterium]